jgi:hypothetical protein
MKKQTKLFARNIIQQLMMTKVTKFHMTAEVISVQGELGQGCLKLLKSSDYMD